MILILPTTFFLPKFFELRLETRLISNLMKYNCTIHKPKPFHAYRNESSTSVNSFPDGASKPMNTKSNYDRKSNESENACDEILQLINSTSNENIFDEYRNANKILASSMKRNELILFDGRLNISYEIVDETAYINILDSSNKTLLDHTEMRKNSLYYNVYILGLTTTLTQIIPMAILLFFNIKICSALKASGVMRRQFLSIERNESL